MRRISLIALTVFASAPALAAGQSFEAQCTGQTKIVAGNLAFPAVSDLKSFAFPGNVYLEDTTITSYSDAPDDVDNTYYSAKSCYGVEAKGAYSITLDGQTYSTDAFGPTDMHPQYFDSSGNSDTLHGGFVYCINNPESRTPLQADDLPKGALKFQMRKFAVKSDFDRQNLASVFKGLNFSVHMRNSFGNGVTVWFQFASATQLRPLYYVTDTAELIGDFGNPPFDVFDTTSEFPGEAHCQIRLK